jgi:hypothetical protein
MSPQYASIAPKQEKIISHYDGCACPDKRKITKLNQLDGHRIDQQDRERKDTFEGRATIISPLLRLDLASTSPSRPVLVVVCGHHQVRRLT